MQDHLWPLDLARLRAAALPVGGTPSVRELLQRAAAAVLAIGRGAKEEEEGGGAESEGSDDEAPPA